MKLKGVISQKDLWSHAQVKGNPPKQDDRCTCKCEIDALHTNCLVCVTNFDCPLHGKPFDCEDNYYSE